MFERVPRATSKDRDFELQSSLESQRYKQSALAVWVTTRERIATCSQVGTMESETQLRAPESFT